jgi:hypothetical protein
MPTTDAPQLAVYSGGASLVSRPSLLSLLPPAPKASRPRLRGGGLGVGVKKEKAAPGGATFVCLGWIPRLSDGGRGRRASCDKPVHRCA